MAPGAFGGAGPSPGPHWAALEDKDPPPVAVHPSRGFISITLEPAAEVFDTSVVGSFTADQLFTLAKGFTETPIRATNYQFGSQYFKTYQNVTSSMDVRYAGGVHIGPASGKFSSERMEAASEFQSRKSSVFRAEVTRAVRQIYSSSPSLAPAFRRDLIRLIQAVSVKRLEGYAKYLGDMIVLKYGDAYQLSVTLGFRIVKTDYLDFAYTQSSSFDSSAASASASFSFHSFLGSFGASAGMGRNATDAQIDAYSSNITSTKVQNYGGSGWNANDTLASFEAGAVGREVPIGMTVSPLWTLLTADNFPEVIGAHVAAAAKMLKDRIAVFHRANVVKGCGDYNAVAQFDINVNVNDAAACTAAEGEPFMLGGAFSAVTGPNAGRPEFAPYNTVNPATGTASCSPDTMFFPVRFATLPLSTTTYWTTEEGWWLWRHAVQHSQTFTATAEAYWCAPRGQVPAGFVGPRYLFGGMYTPHSPNLATGAESCPSTAFIPVGLNGGTVTLCLSQDEELAGPFAVDFGGMMSACDEGNPLASPAPANSSSAPLPAAPYPFACPMNYTRHMVAVDGGCELDFCARANSFASQELRTVRLPPFAPFPVGAGVILREVIASPEGAESESQQGPISDLIDIFGNAAGPPAGSDANSTPSASPSHGAGIVDLGAHAGRDGSADAPGPAAAQPAGTPGAEDVETPGRSGLGGGAVAGITLGVLIAFLVAVYFVRKVVMRRRAGGYAGVF